MTCGPLPIRRALSRTALSDENPGNYDCYMLHVDRESADQPYVGPPRTVVERARHRRRSNLTVTLRRSRRRPQAHSMKSGDDSHLENSEACAFLHFGPKSKIQPPGRAFPSIGRKIFATRKERRQSLGVGVGGCRGVSQTFCNEVSLILYFGLLQPGNAVLSSYLTWPVRPAWPSAPCHRKTP